MADEMPVCGIVLSGGGARAAYQAGVLRYIFEHYGNENCPIRIFTGASAGAINVAAMAAGAAHPDEASKRLWNVWENIHHDQVFRSDTPSLLFTGGRLLYELIFGGSINRPRTNYLLNNRPLKKLLQKEIIFSAIRLNIKKGLIKGIAVSATNYLTGTNITFYDTALKNESWVRSQRIAQPGHITIDHLMASTAIPVFFPPVYLEGSYFADGSVRLSSPLSPAIHLGADKIISIGIHHRVGDRTLMDENRARMRHIYMADIAGLMLSSIFTDALEADIERMQRINRSVQRMTDEARREHPDRLRKIDLLHISPSVDLRTLAEGQFSKFPAFLRYLLRGIGATKQSGSELISYLSYDKSYTSKALELGYNDARNMQGKLDLFFESR